MVKIGEIGQYQSKLVKICQNKSKRSNMSKLGKISSESISIPNGSEKNGKSEEEEEESYLYRNLLRLVSI